MKVSAARRQQSRDDIIEAARRLFNQRGFSRVSIGEVMSEAGLTHGGFYRHFKSKSELYAEAIRAVLARQPLRMSAGRTADASYDMGAQIIRGYLSSHHFDNVDCACPMVTLPSEVAKEDQQVKEAFEEVLNHMISVLSTSPNGEPGS